MAGGEYQVELLGGGCVVGLDGVGVDPCGRGWIGVIEAGGYRGDWNTGVDHQRGVRVAQAVDGDIRQVVYPYEITEPTADGVRMDRHTGALRIGALSDERHCFYE